MIMSVYGCNMNLELQQRAVEYNAVIKKFPNLRDGLFEQMPPIEMKERFVNDDSLNQNDEFLTEEEQRQQQEKNKEEVAKTLLDLFEDDAGSAGGSSPLPPHLPGDSHQPSAGTTNGNNILDLFDQPAHKQPATAAPVATNQTSSNVDLLFGLDSAVNVVTAPVQSSNKSNQDIMSLFGSSSKPHQQQQQFNGMAQSTSSNLDDIFNLNGPSVAPTQQQKNLTNGSSNPNDIMSLFGGGGQSTAPASATVNHSDDLFGGFGGGSSSSGAAGVVVAYEKNDVKITMEPDTAANSLERPVIRMRAHNTSVSSQLREVLFSSAVPKSMMLQLSPPTTKVIQPMDSMSQTITISNPTQVEKYYFIFYSKI
jgi:hypothetical protein